jgi:hypothetical protein
VSEKNQAREGGWMERCWWVSGRMMMWEVRRETSIVKEVGWNRDVYVEKGKSKRVGEDDRKEVDVLESSQVW